MPAKPLDCRAAAARCLQAVTNGSSLSQQIPVFERQVNERDRALFRQLCYGVLRAYPKLLGIARLLLSKPLKAKDGDILQLILLGLYQLSDTRIPDHAAVSSCVNATRALKKVWAKGLLNGVLRRWQREQSALLEKLSAAEAQAHPDWLYQALKNAWPDHHNAIVTANNQHPPMCLRVNALQTSREDYLARLSQQSIDAQACDHAALGLRLTQALGVDKLPGFYEGQVSVQDEAPQLCAELLPINQGARVLDACAAPGGKTCQLLERHPQLGELIAVDIDGQRLKRVQDNLERLELAAELIAADLCALDSWWDGQAFDAILLDAPCSATGVMRRNPDIKLHRQPADIDQLAKLQPRILNTLWQTLKPGGHLLYATCSVLPQENEQVVGHFCDQQADVEHRLIEADWGIARPFGRQLLPQVDGHDGFYYALLKKRC